MKIHDHRKDLYASFMNWQRDAMASTSEGLSLIRDYMDASAISVIRAKPQQAHPQYFKSLPEQAISDGHACELISKYAQADGIHTDSFRVTSRQCYATSYIFRSRNAEETLIISLWHENLLDLNDADQIFLDMAIEACRLRIGAKYIKDFRQPHIISEAFDAVDDGFIIYDKDQQIIAYNQRQQDLFPSVTGTLQIGFEYEAILRKQLASGQLNIPDTEAEEWIERRKKQLKDHRHTEEQKFENGKTIRLTNYQTSSGGTVAVRSDITELVEARQRAVENEQLFRALLIGAPIPLFIITGMEIVYANSYAESLFDAGSEGLLSLDVRDFYVDQDHRRHLLSKIEREGYLRGDTLNIKTLKNVEKTVILSANMITYKGNPSYFVSLMDITDMITAQTALQQSEQQYRALNELIPDALVLQIDGKVALVNESAISTFRVNSISDLVGLSSINLVAPDERPRLQEFRKKVLKSGKPEQIQTRYQRMDGDIFHVEMHSQAMIWNGRQGTLNFIRDVTARHIYERELLRREREMALAQTIGRFGHWRVDLQKQEVYWSKELFNIYMRPISEKPISPKEAATLIFPDDLPKVQEDYFDLIKTGQSKILPLRVIRSDGAIRHVETSMQPELDSKGVVQSIFGVTQDITERKELEERLRQSQKMEAVGQLTGGVAHDFNNLLAVIQGNAELLQEMLDPQDEKLKARTEVILEAAERGADLTKSMLAFGRTQALNPATINLNDNVAKMLKVLDRTIEKNIHICLDTDPALWDCFADPGQVENAILNLTINSRDAMPNGGQLTLKTNNVTLAGDELKKADNQPEGDYVRLSVTDTGQGIDSEKLEHVFEPFFTTKEVGKGTGLGLSMVYGFIKQSNGHIDIQSVVGEGTSVDIYLPKHTLN